MDPKSLICSLSRTETPSESDVLSLCSLVEEVFLEETNIVSVPAPVTVVGDLHGQLLDLLELFNVSGLPPDTNFVFLGDFVDRGPHGVELICLLFCYKLLYPSKIILLRGNHESRSVTKSYGFYNECFTKYGKTTVWSAIMSVFDTLPPAAVIDDQVLGVHGGISPQLSLLDQLRVLDRVGSLIPDSLISDLLWADPDTEQSGFKVSPRGAGWTFGADVLAKFLHLNNLEHVVRAHQLCNEGFQLLFDNNLTTVWSAPNYMGRCGNLASVLEVSEYLEFSFNVFLLLLVILLKKIVDLCFQSFLTF
ncbi:hypothetical protein RCL1_004355 [Eukaryota sp. TZLM3-RCL]